MMSDQSKDNNIIPFPEKNKHAQKQKSLDCLLKQLSEANGNLLPLIDRLRDLDSSVDHPCK